jgi:formylmethanofuran dehydrogenase subunit E
MKTPDRKPKIPVDLKRCVEFHGHICPGLIYGYRVAKEAVKLMKLKRSVDEEMVAVCENNSCAVDALQIMLGTVAGKGNLIIQNYGKNAYTVLSRSTHQAYRFSLKTRYDYTGKNKKLFDRLEAAVSAGTATDEERKNFKRLKIHDLVKRPFDEIFTTAKVPFSPPRYAQISPSEPCAVCGEMTMASKMKKIINGRLACVPCSKQRKNGKKRGQADIG